MKTLTAHVRLLHVFDKAVCVKTVSLSYAGDEFEAGLFIGLRGQTGILSTRVDGGIWRFKCRLEEVGDFGESAECGGIWVLDKSLFGQKENRRRELKRPLQSSSAPARPRDISVMC